MEGRSEGKKRITRREAAALLGVHYNTVKNRIDRGEIKAEKVVTEHGPTWLIDPDSLTHKAHPTAEQQLVGRVPEEALTFLAREIVREAGLQREEHGDLLRLREHDARIERYSRHLEALRGLWSVQFEIAKHTSAASGVLLLGLGAFVGVFYPDLLLPQLAYVSAVLLVLCAIGSIAEMFLVRNVILHQIVEDVKSVESAARLAEESESEEDEQARTATELERNTERFSQVSRITILSLVGGAACFLGFALYNLTGGVWP